MMRVEEMHRKQLAEQRASAASATSRCAVTREMIFDVEAPDYDEVRMNMTAPRRARHGAALGGQGAPLLPQRAARRSTSAEVKKLFEELCAEEVEHQALVKAELDKLAPEKPGDRDDFSDDPVAQ